MLSSILFKLVSVYCHANVQDLPNTTDIPVLFQHRSVDILAMDRVIKVRLDNKVTKVNL